jgi:DNA-binding response OmpR family regulator
LPEYQPLHSEFLAQRKILVVDDDPKMCELMVAILKDSYEVIQAADAAGAIAKAREALPDLIFLDIRLPGADGYSVCQTLKADPRTQPIPIVMLSALADVDEKVRGIDLGADDYITKPFDPQELRARIQMILRRASVR